MENTKSGDDKWFFERDEDIFCKSCYQVWDKKAMLTGRCKSCGFNGFSIAPHTPAYHLKAINSMANTFKAREKAYRVVLAATQDFVAGRLSKEMLKVVVDEFEDKLL